MTADQTVQLIGGDAEQTEHIIRCGLEQEL
jgi:hypothetical protein